LIIDVDGARAGGRFSAAHTGVEENEDRGEADEPIDDEEDAGDVKWKQLVAELMIYKGLAV
jgi:hypothetical protein